jgi:hypothetical protein
MAFWAACQNAQGGLNLLVVAVLAFFLTLFASMGIAQVQMAFADVGAPLFPVGLAGMM